MMLSETRSRSTRWLIARPERLLGWWLFLLLFGLLGVVLAMFGMPVYYLVPFIVPGWLQLAVDLRYMPRAFRAWRNSSGGSAMAPSER
jgi:urea transporter